MEQSGKRVAQCKKCLSIVSPKVERMKAHQEKCSVGLDAGLSEGTPQQPQTTPGSVAVGRSYFAHMSDNGLLP